MRDGAASGFRVLDHTADVRLAAWGRNLREAFVEAARGMFSVVVDIDTVVERVSRRVAVEAEDEGDLLVRWLNALLYYVDTERLVFGRFEIQELGQGSLRGVAHGEPLDPERHHPNVEVKSATYHELAVAPGPPARVHVILDI